MPRRFTRGRGRLGEKRQTLWLFSSVVQQSLDGNAALVGVLNAAALALRPFTVVRTHLEVYQTTDQIAASEDQIGGVGMCVVNDSATATGVGAVPTPLSELGSDLWFLHSLMISEFVFLSAIGVLGSDTGVHKSIDSKAMRKVNNDQDVALVVEGSTTGAGMVITTIGRILVKLH